MEWLRDKPSNWWFPLFGDFRIRFKTRDFFEALRSFAASGAEAARLADGPGAVESTPPHVDQLEF